MTGTSSNSGSAFWRGHTSQVSAGVTCPHCAGPADGATTMSGGPRPTDGAVALCFYCGGVGISCDDVTRIRAPSPMELMAIEASGVVQRARATRDRINRRRGGA
jgi:hypothetical protein